MQLTTMIFVIIQFVWFWFWSLAVHNTLMKIAKNTEMPSVTNVRNYSGPGEDPRGR